VTLIQAQDRYISRVCACHPGHINRVRRSARRELHQWAAARGFNAEMVCRDASDMANLQSASDE
jgi:hypothetical protein